MHRSTVYLLAIFQLLLPGSLLAAACVPGPSTGAEMPVATHLRSYPWTFHAPTRMALGAASSLLISDPVRARVVTRDASGRVTDTHNVEGMPVSVAVDGRQRIYLGDGQLGKVSVYSQNWEFLSNLGIGAGEFRLPGAIAVHPENGRIYVADSDAHQLRAFDGDGEFRYPAGLFVDAAAGELLVADQLNYRVQVFDLDGNYLRCIGGTNANPGGFFGRKRPLNQPQGVWVDGAGRVLVSDAADGQVKVFDRNGNGLGAIGEFGIRPGELRIPMDLVVDAHRRLFVAAANNGRLEVFGLDDFEDPESIAPAVLEVDQPVLDRDLPAENLRVALELPGHRLDAIVPGTLQVNGIPPLSLETGDADRDLNPELSGLFDGAALLQTLPWSGTGTISASALLNNGLQLAGEALVEVRAGDLDPDGDGVEDPIDLCPDTEPGAPTDLDGCSVAQHCPCSGSPESGWRNHGQYMACVNRAVARILEQRNYSKARLIDLKPAAARASCGKPAQSVDRPQKSNRGRKRR